MGETSGRGGEPVDRASVGTVGGDTPAVTRHQAGEAELGHRRGQVISDPSLMVEELPGHHCAHRVTPQVLRPGVARAVPIKADEWIRAAGLQLTAEDIVIGHAPIIAYRSARKVSPSSPATQVVIRSPSISTLKPPSRALITRLSWSASSAGHSPWAPHDVNATSAPETM